MSARGQENSRLIVAIQILVMAAVVVVPFLQGLRPLPQKGALDQIAGVVFQLGLILVAVSMFVLRKKFTIATDLRENTRLVTRFPFNFSRNPVYLGLLMMTLAWSVLQRSVAEACLTILLAIVLNEKIKIEERNLEKVFGDEYREYRRSVRRFI